MFIYKKIEIDRFTKSEPSGHYEEVFVISALTEDYEPDDDEVFYFDIRSVSVEEELGNHNIEGYMRGIVSKEVMENRELYLVITEIEGYEKFFLEPVLYESIDEDELSLILHETIEFMIMTEDEDELEDGEDFEYTLKLDTNEDEDDNLEDFDFILDGEFEHIEYSINEYENNYDLEPSRDITVPGVNHKYLDEIGLFELAGPLREQFGKRFITSKETLQFAQSLGEFREQGNYIYHHEPALYAINEDLIVFANSKDISEEKFRLLTFDDQGQLMEVVRYRLVDSMDLMKTLKTSIRDSSKMFEIRKKLFELIYYMQE